jgi:hypothetical protein
MEGEGNRIFWNGELLGDIFLDFLEGGLRGWQRVLVGTDLRIVVDVKEIDHGRERSHEEKQLK